MSLIKNCVHCGNNNTKDLYVAPSKDPFEITYKCKGACLNYESSAWIATAKNDGLKTIKLSLLTKEGTKIPGSGDEYLYQGVVYCIRSHPLYK